MKRLLICVTIVLLAFAGNGTEIWVSPKGSDANNGSKDQPLATVAAALRKARELRRVGPMSGGIHIILRGGAYLLRETIVMRAEDAGTTDSPTFIEAAPNEKPILSGGLQINGWKKLNEAVLGLPASAKGKIWVADVPMVNGRPFEFRQLWVNDIKAIRAKSVNGDKMERIISWNKQEQTCMIPTPPFSFLQNAVGVELFIHQWWEIAILRIKKMQMMSDSTKLFFHQPESKIQSEHPWP
ncbi:MAG TPA: hypothetical protein VFN95_15520, partial [Flavitalea sp.]|nr:hypothetical protein [Flavitalea sp.]